MVLSSSLASCLRKNKKFDGILTYVGDGALRTQLEKYIKDNDLQDHVVLAGFQSQTEVPRWMQKNDILTP